MTTLSIEDLKACLAGEPVWTDWSGGERPVGEDDKVFFRMREDTDADVSQRDSWRAGDLIWRHARFDDDGGHFPDNDIVAYRLDPTALSPATIAALIEGYIAMAKALTALRNKIASEADQYNPPPILADDRSDYMAGVQAATHQAQCDFVFELDRIRPQHRSHQ